MRDLLQSYVIVKLSEFYLPMRPEFTGEKAFTSTAEHFPVVSRCADNKEQLSVLRRIHPAGDK